MKFFFSLILSLIVMATPISASANPIKSIVDEFQYALTVEWDQKDHAFYNNKVSQFHSQLNAIGANQNDVIILIAEQTKNANLKAELKNIITLISINKLNKDQSSNMINDALAKHSAAGASWNGEVFLIGGVAAFVAAIFAYVIINSERCNSDPSSQIICETDSFCESSDPGACRSCYCSN